MLLIMAKVKALSKTRGLIQLTGDSLLTQMENDGGTDGLCICNSVKTRLDK